METVDIVKTNLYNRIYKVFNTFIFFYTFILLTDSFPMRREWAGICEVSTVVSHLAYLSREYFVFILCSLSLSNHYRSKIESTNLMNQSLQLHHYRHLPMGVSPHSLYRRAYGRQKEHSRIQWAMVEV